MWNIVTWNNITENRRAQEVELVRSVVAILEIVTLNNAIVRPAMQSTCENIVRNIGVYSQKLRKRLMHGLMPTFTEIGEILRRKIVRFAVLLTHKCITTTIISRWRSLGCVGSVIYSIIRTKNAEK